MTMYTNKNNQKPAELTSIYNVLCISYDSRDLILHILQQLRKSALLNAVNRDDDENDDDDSDASSDEDEAACSGVDKDVIGDN